MPQDAYTHISAEDTDEGVFVAGETAHEVVSEAAREVTYETAHEVVSEAAREVAYEQTSTDLQAEPMSHLQKIIIAVAIVGVIILVAYLIQAHLL